MKINDKQIACLKSLLVNSDLCVRESLTLVSCGDVNCADPIPLPSSSNLFVSRNGN